ncbi:beta-1,6-N-acetylglucosaminyltransferase [aff. Roholtiella sp. LEGE 12411]|uniref:beta-1,6-N-acetylglucosaminyltransferase n=1 Tax=aff. Roholtiella sp. LEGE 12411 TaxID=1828822 RepID=UPI001880D837|nr:beta-1,6-N-acetylglucosaminyltransferase [aff. Roholtiella sp. LEGE 12411]MBE9036803.1 hypothetical protein [aff. Roholtiella sp. LEGE 12411]
MNLAYLVLAHNTPNHLCKLIDALNSPNVQFFIHIDAKSNNSLFKEKINHQNVAFIQDRVSVYWGEFSTIKATINLIREALNSQHKFDYLILISGSDYPLKSASYINDYFAQRAGTEFINLVEMPNQEVSKLLDRLYKYQPQTLDNNGFYRIVMRIFSAVINKVLPWKRDYKKGLGNLKPYGGSQWWALSADACHYILSFVETNPKIVKFFQNTLTPDEIFFQTIIGNSRFREKVAKNLTFTQWQGVEHPELINMEQLQTLKKMDKIMEHNIYGSGELLFARKFKDESSELTNFIDSWMRNPKG